MVVGLYILVFLQALSIFVSIATIGDERKPRTKTEAAINVVLSGLIIWLYVAVINRIS